MEITQFDYFKFEHYVLLEKKRHEFQETEIETMLAEGAKNESLLAKILEYYENLDSLSQEKVSE